MDLSVLLFWIILVISALGLVSNEANRRQLQPHFLPTTTNVTVHKGELALLLCHIRDLGPRVVVWRKELSETILTFGKVIFSQEEHIDIDVTYISEEESHWDLIIKDVQPWQAGIYLCQVTATKLYTHYVTLQVIDETVKIQPTLHISGTEYVNQGDTIKLRCNATGAVRPPEDVEWFLDGKMIIQSHPMRRDRTQVHNRKISRSLISDLQIDNSIDEDRGNYVCRSTTSDLQTTSISVHVLGVEKLPVNKRVSGSSNLSKMQGSKSSAASAAASQLSLQLQLPTLIAALYFKYILYFQDIYIYNIIPNNIHFTNRDRLLER